jgi:hypothetical protein
MGTPYCEARCATPLEPAEEEYGMTVTLAVRKRSGSISSAT